MTCRNGRRADSHQSTNRFSAGPFDTDRYLQTQPAPRRSAVLNSYGVARTPSRTGVWGWMAAVAVSALIAFALIGG